MSIGRAYGLLADAGEFRNQVNAQRQLLDNTADMVANKRDSDLFDLRKREGIIAGSVIARAGKGGVRVEGSVINAAADVAGAAALDRLRITVNAQNQINVLRFQSTELNRQANAKQTNAFIGAGVELGASFLSMGVM